MATYEAREIKRQPTHPGELLEELLELNDVSASELARQIHVRRQYISMIVRCQRPVTCGMALRLARFFGGNARVWTGMQSAHDSWQESRSLDKVLKNIKPIAA